MTGCAGAEADVIGQRRVPNERAQAAPHRLPGRGAGLLPFGVDVEGGWSARPTRPRCRGRDRRRAHLLIECARNADKLRLLPRLCVSSEGAVESIQLITKTPLQQLRSVAVTPESATSVVLTRVLFPDAELVPLGEEAEGSS